jgi:hypothetical protein
VLLLLLSSLLLVLLSLLLSSLLLLSSWLLLVLLLLSSCLYNNSSCLQALCLLQHVWIYSLTQQSLSKSLWFDSVHNSASPRSTQLGFASLATDLFKTSMFHSQAAALGFLALVVKCLDLVFTMKESIKKPSVCHSVVWYSQYVEIEYIANIFETKME